MKFFTTEKLGPKQSLTKEGFLLCEDVPIARTGEMIYGAGETAVMVGADGIARIRRTEEEVFRPETIASFNGKPIVFGHPEGDVSPENWRQLAIGVVLHPRRGTGIHDDVILADLLITEKDAIEAVRKGLREVSCGYDAEYIDHDNGYGSQVNILGNHVALVEAGRCGPRCAIGDSISEQEKTMTIKERLKKLFADKDERGFVAVLDELPDSGATATHVHVHTQDAAPDDDDEDDDDKKDKTKDAAIDARFKKVEDTLDAHGKDLKRIADAMDASEEETEEEKKKKKETEDEENRKLDALGFEAPPGTGDAARKAKDSAYLADSFQESIALAEIIAPGVGIPTFDAKASPVKTYDALCRFRRSVLDLAYAQPEARAYMDEIVQGRELKQFTCDGVRSLFLSVGAFKKRANNSSRQHDSDFPSSGGGNGVRARVKTPAELNKAHDEYYKNQ